MRGTPTREVGNTMEETPPVSSANLEKVEFVSADYDRTYGDSATRGVDGSIFSCISK